MVNLLANTIAFIAGGTGTVGSGLVKDLIDNGAKVYVTSRSDEKINSLKSKIPDNHKSQLEVIKANISNEEECIKVRDEILKKEGRIDHVVSSLGSWWEKGLLSDQSVAELNYVINDALTSHFIVYKTFAKTLAKQPKSTYTFVTGGLGERCSHPKSSLLSVAVAGLFGVYQAAIAEFESNENLKINEVRYNTFIRDQPDKEFQQEPEKHDYEVGNDWTAKFITRAIIKHKGGQYLVKSRKVGDNLYPTI